MHSQKSDYSLAPRVEKESQITLQHLSTAKSSKLQNPHETLLKNSIFWKRERALQESPCMHEGKLPKGLNNPFLREEIKALPVSAKIIKKGLEKKMGPTETLQKQYLWEALEKRKKMMQPNPFLD